MKKTLLNSLTICTLFFATALNAQVGIGVPAENIHPSAELEVKSTTKGFLPPRMTKAERDAIVTPAAGLLIYQTDGDVTNPTGLYFFDGTAWKNGAGVQGQKGDTGETGTQGPKGDTGDQGAQGLQGPKGDQGGVTSKIYTIGLWPELGGYVFRISADGTHGLVAETQDQSVASSWYLAQDAISNPLNHSTNGQKFMDWRLPTKYELNEMYLQKGAIGGFAVNGYWSSTEYAKDFAWDQYFYFGFQNDVFKNYDNYVRSVRAF